VSTSAICTFEYSVLILPLRHISCLQIVALKQKQKKKILNPKLYISSASGFSTSVNIKELNLGMKMVYSLWGQSLKGGTAYILNKLQRQIM